MVKMNSLRCLFKKNTDVSIRIEKDVNKSFTIFDLIYQLILNNKTINLLFTAEKQIA